MKRPELTRRDLITTVTEAAIGFSTARLAALPRQSWPLLR